MIKLMEGAGKIMKLKKIFICGLIVFTTCVSLPLAAAVSDFSDVEIDDEFLPFLTAKKRFMTSSGVKEFTVPGRKDRIIVCIVSVASKGNSARAIANMTKVCRIKAQVELLKTQGVEMSAFTQIADKIVSIDDGKQQKVKSLSTYLNVVEERVDGVIKAMPVIGTWFSKDKTEFYLAVGTVIKK